MASESKDNTDGLLDKDESALIKEFIDFLNASVSPFHAVATMVSELESNGFKRLNERESWEHLAPGNYYFTRNQSTIVAFSKPKNWKQGNGFTIQAAHTDSPVFKVKPKSKQKSQGYLQVGVEAYGGGLWHTWFDRDLSVAGRLLLRKKDAKSNSSSRGSSRQSGNNKNDSNNNNGATSVIVRIDRPILRISTLAIHLNREVRSGFKFNTESETVPIFATEAAAELNQQITKNNNASTDNTATNNNNKSVLDGDHHPILLNLLAKEANCSVEDIIDFELCLFDTNASCVGGALNEFVFSARLDNLGSCFVCMRALLNSIKDESNNKDGNIRIFAAFDNEEVGSSSNRGASSNLLFTTMERLHGKTDSKGLFEAAIQKSILVSCDMAHAIHPNYASKHETQHRPKMHQGLVLKYNSNQRYATNMVSTYHLCEIAKNLGISLQKFIVRNDMPCGSTIGPILATRCGIRTVDVGMAQLSMHSIREVCGVKDVCTTLSLLTEFYNQFEKLDEKLTVD